MMIKATAPWPSVYDPYEVRQLFAAVKVYPLALGVAKSQAPVTFALHPNHLTRQWQFHRIRNFVGNGISSA
jgi:hypothetical protein